MPNDSNRPDVAVFIDFENVYVSVRDKLDANPNFESIMDRCEDFGRVVIARAYADWYRYPRVTSALYANGIEPMYVPTYYYDREMGRTGRAIKNSVDMNLCIDAMKTLFTNTNIAKFVLATGDRDFIPLVNSIRQHGKEVIIIGIGGAASAHLAQSADEFIFYETLVGKKPTDLPKDQPRARAPEREQPELEEEPPRAREREREAPRETPREAPREIPREAPREKEPAATPDIYTILVDAINLARERGYVCSFGSLKLLMKELMDGDFKESKYKDSSGKPFAKFKDFVLEAERRGKVQVFTSGTVNEVFLPGEDPYKLSQFAQDLKEEPDVSPLETPTLDARREGRPLTTTNGRRRRRRPRGGQPSTSPQDEAIVLPGESSVEDDVEEIEYTPPDELLIPDLIDDEQADAVFDELLERVDDEQAEREALAERDPLVLPEQPEPVFEVPSTAIAATTRQADEPITQADEPATQLDDEGQPATLSQPFTDEEWLLLTTVVGRFERPISFAQIHDAMRDSRKNADIVRTNEELRTLIKQAINTGVLERSGKGNRVTYRLAPPAEEAPDQITAIAPPVEEAPDALDQIDQSAPVSQQPTFFTPTAAVETELASPPDVAPIEVSTAAESTIAEATPKPKRSRTRRKPADEPAPVAVVETPVEAAPAPAKRVRSKKPAKAAAAPVVEPAAPAKPARRRQSRAKPIKEAAER